MPSELDRRMDEVAGAITAADGPLAATTVRRFGRDLPAIAATPPSLAHYFAHFCAEHADATFLVAGEERLSYAETYAQAQAVARALVAGFGVARGDRVAIAARNSPAWIALYMGILMAGGVATLLNGWWQGEELAAAIADTTPVLVLADPPRAARLAAAGVTDGVVEIDDLAPLADALAPVTARDDGAAALPEPGPDDHATILFTSGSTGRSRGALSTHHQILSATLGYLVSALTMRTIGEQDGVPQPGEPGRPQHSTLLNLPLFHVTAEVPMLLMSFAIGRKLVLMPKWDASEALRLIEREQITYFVGVPLMSIELVDHPDRDKYDLSSVADFAAGGAPRPADHVARIDAAMTGSPLIGYGLTETNAIGTGNWRGNYLAKPSSCGRAAPPLIELAMLDDAGNALSQGERGEIGIRSVACFEGYWNDPAATAAAFTTDGYFRTGDVGYVDPDGYLFIVDRKKDIIIRGGENISCQEVEAALYAHPQVAEAAVFGLADARLGEVPGAVVYLREAGAVEAEDLAAYLCGHLAAFKVPQRIWIAPDPLPRLGTEKIDKVRLRGEYRARSATG